MRKGGLDNDLGLAIMLFAGMLGDLRKTPLGKTLAVAAVYWLAAHIGLLLAIPNTNATPVWPPSGIALAAVLLLGYKVWPGIFLGAFIANAMAFYASHVSLLNSAVISGSVAVGNTFEALLGAFLLQRFAGSQGWLGRVRGVFKFAALAGVLSCMVSATIGVTSVSLPGIASGVSFQALWWTWWMGDMMGVLLFTPLLLSWRQEPRLALGRQRLPEGLILLALLIAISALAFGLWSPTGANYPIVYMPLLFLVWAAFRFGESGALTALFIVSSVAIVGTVHGVGPFAKQDFHESLLLLQTFMGVVSMMVLLLSAALREGKQVHQELVAAQEELVHKTRMAAMGEIGAVVAHETRNPLGALSNCVQLLRMNAQLTGEDKELLKIMQAETQRLNEIVSDFLAFGRPRPPRFDEVDLHELLDDTLAFLQRDDRCAPSVTVVRRFAPALPKVRADRDQVRQVFWNLFLNAVQVMGEGGTLRIDTRRAGGEVEIMVRDTGRRIPATVLPRIFEPFYTTKADGTGLGLPIARRIVEEHGGRITVESHEGAGTCFTVSIPVHSNTAGGTTHGG